MKELLVKMAITTLLDVLMIAEQLPQLRKAMLKVYRTIGNAYANDPEFQAAVKSTGASA